MNHKVFLDVDGLVADFVGGICKAHNKSNPYNTESNCGNYDIDKIWGMTTAELWQPANNHEFWRDLEPTVDADEIMEIILSHFDEEQVCFLTSPITHSSCLSGKYEWICKHYPKFSRRFLIGSVKHFCAGSNSLLIDDFDKNIRKFALHGGTAILYPRPWNHMYTLDKEKSLLFLKNEIERFIRHSK